MLILSTKCAAACKSCASIWVFEDSGNIVASESMIHPQDFSPISSSRAATLIISVQTRLQMMEKGPHIDYVTRKK